MLYHTYTIYIYKYVINALIQPTDLYKPTVHPSKAPRVALLLLGNSRPASGRDVSFMQTMQTWTHKSTQIHDTLEAEGR